MARGQGAALDRKKLMADPIMMTTIVLLITFLTLFILYPLAILLVDSIYGSNGFSLETFGRIFSMHLNLQFRVKQTKNIWMKIITVG